MPNINEMQYVNMWLKEFHPNALIYPRMRVGQSNSLTGAERLWPDKIFIEDGVVNILEAKIKPVSSGIGQLLGYNMLFPKTPEFFFAKEYPRKMVLLTALHNETIEAMAKEHNIEYVVYRPPMIEEELARRTRAGEE